MQSKKRAQWCSRGSNVKKIFNYDGKIVFKSFYFFLRVIFSLIGAISLIGTLYDFYKVGKAWYLSATNKHDLSGIINSDSNNAVYPMSEKIQIDKEIGMEFIYFNLKNNFKLFFFYLENKESTIENKKNKRKEGNRRKIIFNYILLRR